MNPVRLLGVAALTAALLAVGCSRSSRTERPREPAPSTEPSPTSQTSPATPTTRRESAPSADESPNVPSGSDHSTRTQSEAISAPAASSAEGLASSDPTRAVQQTLQRLSAGDAAALWDFLPPSHQQQLNAAVRQFGNRVDPQSWRACVELARAVAAALNRHADWVTDLPEVRRALERSKVPPEQFAATWQVLTALVEQALASRWCEPERLQRFDGRAFLQEQVTPLLQQLLRAAPDDNPLARLAQTRVELLRRTGQTAVLQLTAPNQQPATHQFVQVDGRWVPASLTNQWPQWLAAFQSRLNRLAQTLSQANRPAVLDAVEELRPTVARLAAAQSPAEFAAAWRELADQLRRLAEAKPSSGAPAQARRTPRPPVRLVVRARLTNAQLRRVDAWLERVVPDSEVLTDFGASVTTFVIEGGPEPAELAKRVDFGRVTRVDEQKRTVEVQLPASADTGPH